MKISAELLEAAIEEMQAPSEEAPQYILMSTKQALWYAREAARQDLVGFIEACPKDRCIGLIGGSMVYVGDEVT